MKKDWVFRDKNKKDISTKKSSVNIFDVRIDNFSKKEILEKIGSFLDSGSFHQIATVNPEFILQAQKDEKFKSILNGCALNMADGIGIRYAFWRYGKNLKARIAGIELMHEVLNLANKKSLGVFLAASNRGLSTWEETAGALRKKYPRIKFSGENMDPMDVQTVGSLGCEILLCNFGAPRQEFFINSQKNDRIRLAMGVGGSFDFVTEKISRAPKVMRVCGLEWLWRLFLEPRYRGKRIFNAICIFPLRVLFYKNR
jgi:N-acetylglucosaminyldiphosphoundecaprenol N-acetyl-beta-D-mannosaminyltransferase